MGLWNLNKVIESLSVQRHVETRDAYNDAVWIWEEGMGYQPGQKKDLTTEEEIKLKDIIERIRQGEPVQYVIGHAWFYGLKFKVSPEVLIPRPETEELVHWILSDIGVPVEPLRILDIGTGSGCIAIALKHHLKDRASVTAIDISEEALMIAEENASRLKCEINFIQRDFLAVGIKGLGTWDIIVSNPPYISRADRYEPEHPELIHEPDIALYSPVHPDQFYMMMSEQLPPFLTKEGSGYFEMNEFRAELIEDYFRKANWVDIEMRHDMQGRARMLKAKNKRWN